MEEKLARVLLHLFFKAPMVNGLLVFEDNEYLGIVFKKDVERGVATGDFNLFENISFVKIDELQEILFHQQVGSGANIPVIDKAGNLIKIISYDEFISQMQFEKFLFRFDLESVLDNMDHPIVITNFFKKVLYLNKKALEMFQEDIIGRKMSELLKTFEIEIIGDKMIVSYKEDSYHLMINNSSMKNFSYNFYQFYLI